MLIKEEKSQLRTIDKALQRFLLRQFPQANEKHAELAALISYQLSEGNLCLPLALLDKKASELQLKVRSSDLSVDSEIFSRTSKQAPVCLDCEHLYLHRYWQLEQAISQRLLDSIIGENLSPAIVEPILSQLFPAADEKYLEENESNWQKIACLLSARQKFSVITGGPGTGKTTTVIKLLALLQTLYYQEHQGYLSVLLAAPTGKAAARLAESIANALETVKKLGFSDELIEHLPAKATTLHRLLGRKAKTRHFKHNKDNPLTAELLVVDEASMIDIDMMQALLSALPSSSRLILVGDKDQLASVEAGSVMNELCRDADLLNYSEETLHFIQQCGCVLKADAQIGTQISDFSQVIGKLQKCWRAESRSIIDLANAINQQEIDLANTILSSNPNELFREAMSDRWVEEQLFSGELGIKQLLSFIKEQKNQLSHDDLALETLKNLTRQQLLSPLRQGLSGVQQLNQIIRAKAFSLAKQQGLIDHAQPYSEQFFISEPVLVTKNLYDLGVMNGDIGIVLPYGEKQQLRVAFADGQGGIRWILTEQLEGYCQGAYAITVHQSQGSEYDRVLLYLPDEWNPVLSKELIYTAITRAKKQFVLLETEQTGSVFSKAVANKTERFSALAKRLYQF